MMAKVNDAFKVRDCVDVKLMEVQYLVFRRKERKDDKVK